MAKIRAGDAVTMIEATFGPCVIVQWGDVWYPRGLAKPTPPEMPVQTDVRKVVERDDRASVRGLF